MCSASSSPLSTVSATAAQLGLPLPACRAAGMWRRRATLSLAQLRPPTDFSRSERRRRGRQPSGLPALSQGETARWLLPRGPHVSLPRWPPCIPACHTRTTLSLPADVEYTLARSRYKFDDLEAYMATAYSVRDRLIESWNDTQTYFK